MGIEQNSVKGYKFNKIIDPDKIELLWELLYNKAIAVKKHIGL